MKLLDIKKILGSIAGAQYRHPLTRKLFKYFFAIVGVITGRDILTKKHNLTPWTVHILDQVKNHGFYFAQAGAFPADLLEKKNNAMREANKLIDDGLDKIKGTKDYLINLDLAKAPKEAVRSMYEFFASDEIESLASSYLGERALLVELKILVSPVLEFSQVDGSQKWHSDYDDIADLKLFVFLDDVTIDSGPLQILTKDLSRELMKKWRYRWAKEGISHNDEILPHDRAGEIVSVVGSRGSVAFVDAVQCLHRGSRNPKKPRKILYATFNTRTSFRYPPFHWLLGRKFGGSRVSPLLKIDPEGNFLTNLSINN